MKKIKVGSDFSGVGAFDQALLRLEVDYESAFACDSDYYARMTFILNYGTKNDLELANSSMHKIFCDGISAIQNRNLKTLNGLLIKSISEGDTIEEQIVDFKNKANDFAKGFSFYYPFDVYDREMPNHPLDIYMTSPPCQAFSLAGKRKGEEDKRGVLFYNSHEFIEKNKPRFFIFENVKGLLSDDGGKTFQRWIDFLGGKSVNGNPVLFPHEESVPYHIYYKVLNAKNYGVPQNRERIFIVGIRDDQDNDFFFPVEIELKKRLKDILEQNVDEKYYLSENMINGFVKHSEKHSEKGNGFKFEPKKPDDIFVSNAVTTVCGNRSTDTYLKVGYINQDTQASQVFNENGIGQTLCAGTHGYANGYVSIGAIRGRNPDNPKSRQSGLPTEQMLEINEQGLSNCLTTVQKDNVVVYAQLKGGKWDKTHEQSGRVYDVEGVSPTIHTMQGGNQEPKIAVKSANLQGYEIAEEEEEDSINLEHPNSETRRGRVGKGVAQTLTTSCNQGIYSSLKIRKLTPRECFRLMDFPDSFKWDVSNSQAYKQAGNSIVVAVLAAIIKKLNL